MATKKSTTKNTTKQSTTKNQRNPTEEKRQWNQIVARAWADDDFKQRLLSEPEAVLKEHGIPVPKGVNVSVKEVTDPSDGTLILPPKPAGRIADYNDPEKSVYDDTFYSIF